MEFQEIFIPYHDYHIQADLYGDFRDIQKSVIVMAHGLGGGKNCGLDKFALFYQKLGYLVCVFDHSGFGQSTGPVKNLVDKKSQIQDWQTVIHFLNSHFHLSPSQMILWGYSFSGAHVLSIASETENKQSRFKAILSNFPHIDGLASLTLYPKQYLAPATAIAVQDLAYSVIGKVKTMPVVAPDRFAILAGQDCYEGYYSIIPNDMSWDNAVPARIVATIGLYRPTTIIHKIHAPVLMVGARQDSLIPIRATRKAGKKILQGEYAEIDCGHFDLFHEPYHSILLKMHQDFLEKL